MILKKDNLALDKINLQQADILLSTKLDKAGMVISVQDKDVWLPVAYIYWNSSYQDCYIETVADRFQTYIVLYETFANFVYLVDEAYDMMRAERK